MRFLVIITILLLATNRIAACVYGSFSIWPPPQTTISTQPVFVITMKGFNLTDSIRAHKGVFLVTNNDTVFFEVLDTFKGDYAHFQVVVKPERRLINNKVYSFECDSSMLERYGYKIYKKFPRKYTSKKDYYIITTWKTNDSIKRNLPSTPSLKYKKNKYTAKWTYGHLVQNLHLFSN